MGFFYLSPINLFLFGYRLRCDFLLRALLVRALTHVCVLIVLFRTHSIGQFTNGVFNHHKVSRPLHVILIDFVTYPLLFDDMKFLLVMTLDHTLLIAEDYTFVHS